MGRTLSNSHSSSNYVGVKNEALATRTMGNGI